MQDTNNGYRRVCFGNAKNNLDLIVKPHRPQSFGDMGSKRAAMGESSQCIAILKDVVGKSCGVVRKTESRDVVID